jgi:elongation of very long chain fatty acids protein 4
MRSWPAGDAYFGALLNSWIHVMMYSYYTLSLLKFPCPWKRSITQAQLLQFMSVVVYTVFSTYFVYREGKAEAKHYACYFVQTFEMVSMLYLFSLFYSKAYKRRQMKRINSELDVPEQYSISSDSSDSSSGESKKEL